MPTWTDATMLRLLIKNAGTPMSDAEIESLLDNAEGYLSLMLKIPTSFTFSAANKKHLVLREAALYRTVADVITSTPMSHQTLDDVSVALDVYRDKYIDCVGLLQSKDDIRGDLLGE